MQPSVQKERIKLRFIEEEMRESFIDYSMSVIVQRALPDARDGLKPVHRRILYAMLEAGLVPGRPHKKSATVVGDVLGKYHPHGDSAVYDTIVRMVQDFSLRYPLIDGQGNFGSIDGDSAAAYRYTEVRLTPLAMELLTEIDKETVELRPNFDGRLQEPEVLPTRLPHLLLNGADGIAVGMATKTPPHNLAELLQAADHLVARPDCEVEELMQYVRGPDFPTGGYIFGRAGIEKAYRTGRGLVDMRARMHLEEGRFGKKSLVVTELPYQVNKTRIIEQIAKVVRSGRTDAITELRDESDRDGVRLVIELKRDADPVKVVQTLFKKTQLRYTYGVIMLALVNGKPEEVDLKEALECFVRHRLEVIRRQAAHDLGRSEARAHIVDGLLKALLDIDRVIELIRSSRNPAAARNKLRSEFKLTEAQADAILAMRLAQLTGLEHKKLEDELAGLRKAIERLGHLVEEEGSRRKYLRLDLKQLIDVFGDPGSTEILDDAQKYPLPVGTGGEATVVLLSRQGYVKAQPARSGTGLAGVEAMTARAGDFVSRAVLSRGSGHLLVLTEGGHAFDLPISSLPQGTRSSRGRKLSDFIKLDEGEEIAAVLPVESYEAERELVIVTSQGQVKRTPLAEYANIRSGGIIATGLAGSDRVLAAFLTRGQAEIFMATRLGQSIRFREEEVRSMGRTARGVKGIDLARTDLVVSALAPRRDAELLIATTRGYGKRVPFTEMKLQGRAGKGIGILPERDKAGQLIGVLEVLSDDRVMWETEGGALVETGVSKARVRSRRGTSVPVAGLPEDARSFASVRPVRTATRAAAAESEGTAGTGEPTGSEGAESDPQPSGPAGRFAQAELELPEE